MLSFPYTSCSTLITRIGVSFQVYKSGWVIRLYDVVSISESKSIKLWISALSPDSLRVYSGTLGALHFLCRTRPAVIAYHSARRKRKSGPQKDITLGRRIVR